jgi:hypothetical protein
MKVTARTGALPARPRALRFSHSGKRLAVSTSDTTTVVYDIEKLPAKL